MPQINYTQDSTTVSLHTDNNAILHNLPPGNESKVWKQTYFPIIILAAVVVIAVLVATIYGYKRWRRKQRQHEGGHDSLPLSQVPSQICLYPAPKPLVNAATTVQPPAQSPSASPIPSPLPSPTLSPFPSPIPSSKSSPLPQTDPVSNAAEFGLHDISDNTTSTLHSFTHTLAHTPLYTPMQTPMNTPLNTPCSTPPLRIKKLGLLERRGSNASLVLDLVPANPAERNTNPSPRESSVDEYLSIASNKMSRIQLRNCLKDVKTLHKEFWEIPMNHPSKVAVPGSGMKNRYRTIIPNEQTRVILPENKDDPLSVYINANYIRGYGMEEKAFIATQGPMEHTIEDFWRMIWKDKVPVIIMITKLKEQNKIKCERYIPETSCTYGRLEVSVADHADKDGYILKIITLKIDNQVHSLRHYWYTTWPDHTAPHTAMQLLTLIEEVEKYHHNPHTKKLHGPIVVHCSAGIGRTGCFIATSIGVQQLKRENTIDVLGIVCAMRKDRGGMVQTNEQYEFIHQALCLYENDMDPLATDIDST